MDRAPEDVHTIELVVSYLQLHYYCSVTIKRKTWYPFIQDKNDPVRLPNLSPGCWLLMEIALMRNANFENGLTWRSFIH